MMANKRKHDVPSQRDQEQAPKQPKVNPFDKMMTPGAQGLTFVESHVVIVKWPNDFDKHGSQTYKIVLPRQEGGARQYVTGWELTTHGLSVPKALGKLPEEEEEEEVGPLHPLFKFHKQCVFRLSGVALKNFADAYKVTSIEGKKIDSRHFLKMASQAEEKRKQRREEGATQEALRAAQPQGARNGAGAGARPQEAVCLQARAARAAHV